MGHWSLNKLRFLYESSWSIPYFCGLYQFEGSSVGLQANLICPAPPTCKTFESPKSNPPTGSSLALFVTQGGYNPPCYRSRFTGKVIDVLFIQMHRKVFKILPRCFDHNQVLWHYNLSTQVRWMFQANLLTNKSSSASTVPVMLHQQALRLAAAHAEVASFETPHFLGAGIDDTSLRVLWTQQPHPKLHLPYLNIERELSQRKKNIYIYIYIYIFSDIPKGKYWHPVNMGI